jgi:hypothetical protein
MAGDGEAKETSKRAKGRTPAEFGTLCPAEKMLLEACRTGELASIADERPKEQSSDNSIRPTFLRFLTLGGDDEAPIHERGVQLAGAWIDGDIDFECCRIGSRLTLFNCFIAGKLNIQSADLLGLFLDGSTVEGINGDDLRCRGGVHLGKDFHATGEVRLSNARIRGGLNCADGRFEGKEGAALTCDGIEAGSVDLNNNFHATGKVSLLHARIRRDLDCAGGRFEGTEGAALTCDGIEAGSVYLNNDFHATGEVRLIGAHVGSALNCTGGRFDSKGRTALNCDGFESGVVFLDGSFHATGQVRMVNGRIGGNLECAGGRFDGVDGVALLCNGIEAGGNVFLRNGLHVTGGVRLGNARIGSNLDCDRGRFEATSGYSLRCERAQIQGALHFRELVKPEQGKAGVVVFLGAHASTLTDDAASWQTASALVLDGFTYGRITGVARTDQPGSTIVGDAPPRDAKTRIAWLDRQERLHLERDFRPQPWQQLARVLMEMGHEDEGRTVLIEMRKRQRGGRWKYRDAWWQRAWWFVLTRFDWVLGALVAYGYRPHRAMWLLLGLWLAGGLIYWGVASAGIMAPTDTHFYLDDRMPAECKVDWIGFAGPRIPTSDEIAKAPNKDSRARLQKQISDDADRRQYEARRVGLDTTLDWSWKAICDRAVPSEYSVFQPFVYSIDIMLPFLELRQEHDFAPRIFDDKGNVIQPLFALPAWVPLIGGTWGLGYVVRLWEWFEIFFGWTLTILIAASVSGIIKKD